MMGVARLPTRQTMTIAAKTTPAERLKQYLSRRATKAGSAATFSRGTGTRIRRYPPSEPPSRRASRVAMREARGRPGSRTARQCARIATTRQLDEKGRQTEGVGAESGACPWPMTPSLPEGEFDGCILYP